MGGLEGTPLEPGQEYSGGQFKPHYPDDWDGLSSDQEGPRRFDQRGLVNEEHPYHADETGHLYGYDPATQQHLKVSPMGGLEGTPEEPGQQYTDYLPPKADRTKGGRDRSARRRVAGDGPGPGSVDDLMFPNHRQPTGADYLAEMEPEDRPGYGEGGIQRCKHCEETIEEDRDGYAHYNGHNRVGEPYFYESDHPAEPDDDDEHY